MFDDLADQSESDDPLQEDADVDVGQGRREKGVPLRTARAGLVGAAGDLGQQVGWQTGMSAAVGQVQGAARGVEQVRVDVELARQR